MRCLLRIFAALALLVAAAPAWAQPLVRRARLLDAPLSPPPTAPMRGAWLGVPSESYFGEHAARVEHALVVFPRDDSLAARRDRDLLLLGNRARGSLGSGAEGAALFGALVLLSAHAPAPLRVLFDHRVHLSPAVFDGSGLGAGLGGRF